MPIGTGIASFIEGDWTLEEEGALKFSLHVFRCLRLATELTCPDAAFFTSFSSRDSCARDKTAYKRY